MTVLTQHPNSGEQSHWPDLILPWAVGTHNDRAAESDDSLNIYFILILQNEPKKYF